MRVEFTYFQPYYGADNTFIYLLTAIIFLLAIISFVKSKFDVVHPSFIYCICLAGCCTLAALYTKMWNLPMHFNTAAIIIVMSMLFLGGGCLAEFCCCTDKYASVQESVIFRGFFISWSIWLLFLGILVYFAYLNYTDFLQVARLVTNEKEFSKMLGPVINGFAHQEIKLSRWNAYRLRFAMGMGYLSILAVWLNLMVHQYKEVMKWGCFVLLYIPFLVLTGGRQQFMYLIMFAMISFFMVYRKTHRLTSSVSKEFAVIGVAIVSFLFCFLGIGLVNGKIGADTSFLRVLAHYAGTNISAFDVYLNEMMIPDIPYIGSTTLIPLYGFLHAHGFDDLPVFSMYITLFTVFGPVTTNVYTAFYRYINDFGYFGCALVMFLLGFFYTFFYKKVCLHGLKNWMILIYSSIAYPIFLMGREERFFNEIFTTSKLSFIIGTLILYKFFEFLSKRRSKVK
ncbi:O-antigen polymerase [Megasphaera sp. An286]|uniref:O-antigen polymerase n=1 Tax=Megasphaera sp. An286 TaxID=1965622 RepID=UPI000B3BC7ED|nr:O-antigen polymerase [Megasphaera sp. An286]OUO45675.1 hypothetical protein B5F80_08000 [Megasphaera sp. An286]